MTIRVRKNIGLEHQQLTALLTRAIINRNHDDSSASPQHKLGDGWLVWSDGRLQGKRLD